MTNIYRKINKLLITACITAALSLVYGKAVLAGKDEIKYYIDIVDPVHHLAHVTVFFPMIDKKSLEIAMPVWRTGKYKVLNFAGGVSKFKAVGGKRQALKVKKTDKSTWRILLEKPQEVQIDYELYANQLNNRTRHIDETHAFFDAAASLIYSEQFRDYPISIYFNAPDKWQSRSGLKAGKHKHSFAAPNYDVLVDSPIEIGLHTFHEFKVDNKPHELVIWGNGNQNEQRIINDLSLISKAAGQLWGDYPFERYVWMLHLSSGIRGATEHVNSTIIQMDPYKFSPRKDYIDFLALAAHEFIHTWNVKAYRPKGIHPYGYQKENYTPLLWLVEGSTSYYSPMLLVRSGVISGKEFLERWAKTINAHLNHPGREVQSPADASFDAWLGESLNWDSNAKSSIYTQGMIASLILDLEIRKRTNLEQGFEHVHRLLYERFPLAKGGYTEQSVLKLLNEVSGQNMSKVWEEYIVGTQQTDFESLFQKLGLKMQYGDPKKEKNNPPAPWTGIHIVNAGGDAKIVRVQRNSPGWQAGLTVDDVIIAINNHRVTRESFSKRLKNYKAGDSIKLTFFRRGLLKAVHLGISDQSGEKLKLLPLKNASEEQTALFNAWSGIEWASLSKKESSAANVSSQILKEE